MKAIRFTQTVLLLGLLFSVTSCRTTRSGPYSDSRRYPQYPNYPDNRYPGYPLKDYPVYHDSNPYNLPPGQAKKIYGDKSARPYAHGQRKKYEYSGRRFPLIVIRTPDMVIGRYNDGRYYYHSPEDLWYWKGDDDRFYLDEKYLGRTDYNNDEYRDWKYKGRRHDNKGDEDDWKDHKHGNGKNGWKHDDD